MGYRLIILAIIIVTATGVYLIYNNGITFPSVCLVASMLLLLLYITFVNKRV